MKILVLFKTHLDVGFTDFSENIVNKYMTKYIPDAICVGREIQKLGRKEGFTWTTGSWLIWHYLKYADENSIRVMEEAIKDKLISWHGMAATMHSEAMNGELFDYCLSLSQDLDARFGRTTIGAKMTDVPGHTKAIVPHISGAGIKFLHIGINPASCPVDVPFLFRWCFDNKEIAVMYESGDYGGFRQIPNTDVYVYFAHTGDNLGPQSSEEIIKIYDKIHADYPDAEVVAADLNAVAIEVQKVWDELPILTQEIGDTWIHGVGTDPQKLSQFRALLRLANSFPKEQKEKLFEKIVLVPEHTWGLDEKTHLNENRYYSRALFDAHRNDFKFKKMELSWAEQRKYLLDGVQALDQPYKGQAEAALCEYTRPYITPNDEVIESKEIKLDDWLLSFDDHGAISSLTYKDRVLADEGHRLFGFSYDEYSANDVWAYQERYIRANFRNAYKDHGDINWAINDFGKVGLDKETDEHVTYLPKLTAITKAKDGINIYIELPDEAYQNHGCPKYLLLNITPEDDTLHFDFLYHDKCANRAPEALWLSFKPVNKLFELSKLGYMIDPFDVVSNGARELHATDGKISFDGFDLTTYDAPLISLGGKHIYSFNNVLPDPEDGLYINLFNNQWGTNFPMWTDGDRRFRFDIKIR